MSGLLPSDLVKRTSRIALEAIVVEIAHVGATGFVEAVDVKLPREGGKVVMFEVLGQDQVRELVLLLDYEFFS